MQSVTVYANALPIIINIARIPVALSVYTVHYNTVSV